MDMKMIILVSFILGFTAGLYNDRTAKNYYATKVSFMENFIPIISIIFVAYAFFQSIIFGFMAILQIFVGAFVGGKINRYFKFIK
ncbi:MAG: hypothetical protein DRG78_01845 [Epsilonproteobacteria bacterium]|nr:MAG: hypothetical protein DRG78_01845 [Campylobacterota bacterium]